MSKKHHGSSLDDLLKEEGVFEETQALAIKEVVVWQLSLDPTVDRSHPHESACPNEDSRPLPSSPQW